MWCLRLASLAVLLQNSNVKSQGMQPYTANLVCAAAAVTAVLAHGHTLCTTLSIMPQLPVLLCVREGERWRIGSDRSYVSSESIYSKHVRENLSDVPVGVPPVLLPVNTPSAEWHAEGMRLNMHVVAVALLEPLQEWRLEARLSKAEAAVRKHWLLTKYGAEHLFFIQCREMQRLESPKFVHFASNLGMQMFLSCTPHSAAAVGDSPTTPSALPVRSVVDQWRRAFPGMLAGDTDLSLVCLLPAAHALLLAYQKWTVYAFPFMPNARTRAGMGISCLKGFLPRPQAFARLAEEVQPDAPLQSLLTPDKLEATADCIRAAMVGAPAPAEAREHLQLLQAAADQLYLEVHQKSKKAFEMEFLIRCLMAGGHLKSQGQLAESLRSCIVAGVRNDDLRAYLLQRLHKETIPSTTTMYRHRLTLHIAFCMWISQITNDSLNKPGGVVRYATGDSSPQGRHNWFLCGATSLAVDLLSVHVQNFRITTEKIQ